MTVVSRPVQFALFVLLGSAGVTAALALFAAYASGGAL